MKTEEYSHIDIAVGRGLVDGTKMHLTIKKKIDVFWGFKDILEIQFVKRHHLRMDKEGLSKQDLKLR